MEVFNKPTPNDSCEARDSASVSPQAFTLLNSDLMTDRSIAFALRIEKETKDASAQVKRVYHLALGREPSASELVAATTFLDAQTRQRATRDAKDAEARQLALADFCQAIFAMNEFIYVD